MKKLLALLLIFILCLSVSACKNDETTDIDGVSASSTECTEQDIYRLVERNLDYYYIFCVAPLSYEGDKTDDGYYKADTSFLSDYNAMESLVKSTYISEKASKLLSYPNEEKPLYKNIDGEIYINPDYAENIDYNILWDDTYTVKFTEKSKEECTFELSTTDFDGNTYVTEGKAVFQYGGWVLTDIIC